MPYTQTHNVISNSKHEYNLPINCSKAEENTLYAYIYIVVIMMLNGFFLLFSSSNGARALIIKKIALN